MANKTIKQIVHFNAAPDKVYEILLNGKKQSELTGYEAKISKDVGGKLSMYDGYINGENVELVPGKKIVQTWQVSGLADAEPSETIYELAEKNGGTELVFTQTNIPEEHYDELFDAWMYFYWAPIQEELEE